MPTNHHEERRQAIRELLSRQPAETQASLVAALTARGFTATQSSVSRDLRDLGAVKTGAGYALQTSPDDDDQQVSDVAGLLRGAKSAGPNLLVVKTAIGAAQRVALALDRSNWPEVIGNIGGDDTVFVATKSAAAQRNLIRKIEQQL